jgi:hypothetical protein
MTYCFFLFKTLNWCYCLTYTFDLLKKIELDNFYYTLFDLEIDYDTGQNR